MLHKDHKDLCFFFKNQGTAILRISTVYTISTVDLEHTGKDLLRHSGVARVFEMVAFIFHSFKNPSKFKLFLRTQNRSKFQIFVNFECSLAPLWVNPCCVAISDKFFHIFFCLAMKCFKYPFMLSYQA